MIPKTLITNFFFKIFNTFKEHCHLKHHKKSEKTTHWHRHKKVVSSKKILAKKLEKVKLNEKRRVVRRSTRKVYLRSIESFFRQVKPARNS